LWKTYVCIGFRKPYCCFSSVAIWHIINAIVPLLCGRAFQFLKFLHNGGILLAFKKVPTYHLWFHQKINLSNKISCMVRPSREVTSRNGCTWLHPMQSPDFGNALPLGPYLPGKMTLLGWLCESAFTSAPSIGNPLWPNKFFWAKFHQIVIQIQICHLKIPFFFTIIYPI